MTRREPHGLVPPFADLCRTPGDTCVRTSSRLATYCISPRIVCLDVARREHPWHLAWRGVGPPPRNEAGLHNSDQAQISIWHCPFQEGRRPGVTWWLVLPTPLPVDSALRAGLACSVRARWSLGDSWDVPSEHGA